MTFMLGGYILALSFIKSNNSSTLALSTITKLLYQIKCFFLSQYLKNFYDSVNVPIFLLKFKILLLINIKSMRELPLHLAVRIMTSFYSLQDLRNMLVLSIFSFMYSGWFV